MTHRLKVFLALTLITLVGCNLAFTPQRDITPPPNIQITPAPPATPAPTTDLTQSWQTLAPGLDQRVYIPEDNPLAQIRVLRVDPAVYTFRAHYLPGQARDAGQWRDTLPQAVAVINANFFEADHTVVGLLVTDGVVYGQTLRGRGGTFAVQDGVPRVRSNTAEPYQGEAFQQAVQAFPMLTLNGQALFNNTWTNRPSRRTVIGQDSAGRILLMATPGFGLSLIDLSAFLAGTDMGLVNALNLDGGGSTMMHIAPADFTLQSFDAVPAVLAVYPR